MRCCTALTLGVIAFFPVIYGFTIVFNSGVQCSGSIPGQVNMLVGQGCQTDFLNGSNPNSPVIFPNRTLSAIIQPGADDQQKTGVAFYGESDCQTLIALANVPVCLGVGGYSSFQVIEMTTPNLGFNNLDPAPVQSLAINATASSLPVISSRLSPDEREQMRRKREPHHVPVPRNNKPKYTAQVKNGKRIAHGAIHKTAGQVYVYQQVAKRAWRGIPSHEWNEEFHKRNTADLTAGRHDLAPQGPGISRRDLGPLRIRGISSTRCNLVRSCMIDSGDDPDFGINDALNNLLDAIYTLNPNDDDWTWLQAPFVVEIVGSLGLPRGYIYAQTLQHSQDLSTCSDQGTQRDVLQTALSIGVDGTSVSDMRIDLSLLNGTGVTNSLFVSTRSAINNDTSIYPICEAVQIDY